MGARRSVLPPRRLTATETGGYSGVTIKWRMRHSDDRHARRAIVVAGRRRCGARSSHGWRVAARGAAAVGDATRGANCRHASRETPAAGIDVGRGTLRDGLVGRPPGGDPVGGGDVAEVLWPGQYKPH